MKKTKRYLLLALVITLGLTPVMAAAGVICRGTESGGDGLRPYHYDASTAVGNPFSEFEVGTCDPVLARYTNWILPPGWSVIMSDINIKPDYSGKTAHGIVSLGPDGSCLKMLVFSGPAITSGTFAYDHPWRSHDVSWLEGALNGAITENWAMPVGTGDGPIHAPVPEPGSLLALGSGLAALIGMGIRRRR